MPVILMTGDSEVVKETQALLGNVEGAIVKWPYSFHSAQTLTPQAARELIRQRAAAAVRRIADFKPRKLSGPVTLELSFKNYRPVEMLGYLPIVERVDSHTIRYRAADILQISKFLVFARSISLTWRLDCPHGRNGLTSELDVSGRLRTSLTPSHTPRLRGLSARQCSQAIEIR